MANFSIIVGLLVSIKGNLSIIVGLVFLGEKYNGQPFNNRRAAGSYKRQPFDNRRAGFYRNILNNLSIITPLVILVLNLLTDLLMIVRLYD